MGVAGPNSESIAIMEPVLAFLHGWTALCVFSLSAFLWRSARSMDFRYRMGRGDKERGQNFQLVGFFTFAIGLDLAAAPLGVQGWPHYGAIAFAGIVGAITNLALAWRVWLWKS